MLEPVALSPAAAAAFLSVSRMTIYNLLAAGKLRARKLGNRTLLTAADVRRYFRELVSLSTEGRLIRAPRVGVETQRAAGGLVLLTATYASDEFRAVGGFNP